MTAATTLPAFDLALSGGGRLRNTDLEGKRTVLYFYPKDDTPGCTIEGREFTALRDEFAAIGVTVYGVSPDSAESHDRFVEKCELGIPLISDDARLLCETFDVWKEKSMNGKTYMGVDRSTFVIAPDGSVDHEWRQVVPAGHAREVLDWLGNGG